jgi:hypothetical protein
MSKKKKIDNRKIGITGIPSPENAFALLSLITKGSNFFGGFINERPDPRDADSFHLGHDLYLVVDETIEDNRLRYGKIHKDGKPISDMLFRLGGLGSGFNGKPYTGLISYPNFPEETWGFHCIIDSNGKIVLTQDKDNRLDYPYYLKGVIALWKDKYINLLTGQVITKGSKSLESEQYFFVECSPYSWEKEPFEKGVYKIDKATGEYEIIK